MADSGNAAQAYAEDLVRAKDAYDRAVLKSLDEAPERHEQAHHLLGLMAVWDAARVNTLPLDPEPWVVHSFEHGDVRVSHENAWLGYRHNFQPREGYSQDRNRYPEVNDGRG